MQKTLVAAFLMLISLTSYAQGLSWNAKAGLNMSSMSKVDESKMHPGFYTGIGAEYAFDETWSIRPSLLFTMKGVKQEYEGDKLIFNPMYIELPVMGAVSFPVTDGMNLVVSTGPYFAYGIAGKCKEEYEGDKNEVDFFGNDAGKRFDLGWGVGVAAEFGKFFVDLKGEWGLTKVFDGDDSPKNSNYSIGVGIKF